jgi:hypothetical protein
VSGDFNWIWFVGAAAWFFSALLSMHRHALAEGLLGAALAVLFLAAGMFFRRRARDGRR